MQKLHPVFEFFSVPNGGQRSAAGGALMKLTGALPGVYDIIILGMDKNIIFVENKVGNNGTSKDQDSFAKKLNAFGFKNTVVYASDPIDMVNQYGEIMLNHFQIPYQSISKSSKGALASLATGK